MINDKSNITDLKSARKAQKKSQLKKYKLRDLLNKHAIINSPKQKKLFGAVLKNIQHKKKNTMERFKAKLKDLQENIDQWKETVREKCIEISTPLDPNSNFRTIWDLIGSAFIFIEILMYPLLFGFEIYLSPGMKAAEKIKDIFFIVDLLINFHTAYIKRRGLMVKNHKDIAKRYLKGSFIIDSFAAFAPILFEDKTRSIPDLIRLLRIYRLRKIMKLAEDYTQFSKAINGLLNLIKLILYSMILCHWCACFWNLVGEINIDNGVDSWLSHSGYAILPLWEKYIVCLYWSVMTILTVGYGDIIPKSTSERLITIVVMFLGCIIFAYSMNSISDMVDSINANASKKRQKKYAITKYMEKYGISGKTQTEVKQYIEYFYEENHERKAQEEALLTILSDNLRQKISNEINGKLLRQEKLFFGNFGNRFLSVVYRHLTQRTYSPDEFIFDEFDKEFSIFFIGTGNVQLLITQTDTLLKSLDKGKSFGELSFLTGCPRTAAAKCLTFSTILSLSKTKFLELLDEHPIEKETFCSIRDSVILYKDYTALKLKCYGCGKEGHYAALCPDTHFIADKIHIIKAFRTDSLLFRKSFKRNFLRRRFHAVSDQQEIEHGALAFFNKQTKHSTPPLIIKETEPGPARGKTTGERALMLSGTLDALENGGRIVSPQARSDIMDLANFYQEREKELLHKIETLIHIKSEENEVPMETVQNFQIYFPHNNIKKIIQANQKLKNNKIQMDKFLDDMILRDRGKASAILGNHIRHSSKSSRSDREGKEGNEEENSEYEAQKPKDIEDLKNPEDEPLFPDMKKPKTFLKFKRDPTKEFIRHKSKTFGHKKTKPDLSDDEDEEL